MKLKIEIRMDNAAFEPPSQGVEVARILRDYADRIEYDIVRNFPFAIRDINGNHVGEAKVTR